MVDDDAFGAAGEGVLTSKAKETVYCEICTFPPEVLVILIPRTNGSTANSADHSRNVRYG